ncbi:MAG TPA: alkaline phosphatase family protein [Actinoplanes sp.]
MWHQPGGPNGTDLLPFRPEVPRPGPELPAFDHLVPPMPPQTRAQGLSTVSTVNEIFPGSAKYSAGPYGLGIRVPTIIVSPWTRGGWPRRQCGPAIR